MRLSYLGLTLASNVLPCGCNAEPAPAHVQVSGSLIVVHSATQALQAQAPAPPRNPLPPCATGFSSSGAARLDVLRLGALCGPSNGLLAELRPLSWQPAARSGSGEPRPAPQGARLPVSKRDCVWAVAAAEPSNARGVLRWVDGDQVLAECEWWGYGLCPERGPLCGDPERSGRQVQLEFEADDADRVVVQRWRSPLQGVKPAQ